MSLFNQSLNDKNQFIIAIKVTKSHKPEEYEKGIAQIISASSKRALIDTGASNTCISQEYADDLSLIPIGKAQISTAGDNCDVSLYIIDLAIPVATTLLMPIEKEDGKKSFESIGIDETHWAHTQHRVFSIPAIGKDRGFDVILGMDILSKMHITMFGNQIIMSF